MPALRACQGPSFIAASLNLFVSALRDWCPPLLLALMMLLGSPVWAAGDPLPVFKVSGAGGELVLLGSIHLAYPHTYPLRPAIEAAFDEADTVVVELDISRLEPREVRAVMTELGSYPPGESLRDELSDETWQSLRAFLRGRGLPIEAVQSLRPGLVVTMLGTMRLQELGMKPELGIDLHFLERAGPDKRVIELETLQQQVGLLLDFPVPDLLLRQTLTQLRDLDEIFTPLYAAWLQGDLSALERLLISDDILQHPEFEPVYRRLFDDRNVAMALELEQMLVDGGRYFAVVGAGHLVGEQGIIALLRARGFQVEVLPGPTDFHGIAARARTNVRSPGRSE